MLKKIIKIFAVILILVSILAMLPMTRTYVKELKRDRELMKDPEYVVLIKKPNAYKKKLARKNNHIVRVDIYNADFGYMDGNSTKSLDQYRLVGEITEDNHQLRDLKKCLKSNIIKNNCNGYRFG